MTAHMVSLGYSLRYYEMFGVWVPTGTGEA